LAVLRERKVIAGVSLNQSLDYTLAVAIAPVTLARPHSVPEATQNRRTRSGTLSSAATVEAPFIPLVARSCGPDRWRALTPQAGGTRLQELDLLAQLRDLGAHAGQVLGQLRCDALGAEGLSGFELRNPAIRR
jgi:hypothetical protein